MFCSATNVIHDGICDSAAARNAFLPSFLGASPSLPIVMLMAFYSSWKYQEKLSKNQSVTASLKGLEHFKKSALCNIWPILQKQ